VLSVKRLLLCLGGGPLGKGVSLNQTALKKTLAMLIRDSLFSISQIKASKFDRVPF